MKLAEVPGGTSGGEESLASAGMEERQFGSLSQEVSLEKEMLAHSSVLPGEITERRVVGYSPWGGMESNTAECLSTHTAEVISS